MKKGISVIFLGLVLIIFLHRITYPGPKEMGLKAGSRAPDFMLEDAYGQYYELKKMKGNYVFLIFGNRHLKDENNKWARSLKEHYFGRTDFRIFMVADMRNIPFFVSKNFIKEQISKTGNPVPLLLDWEQKVNKLYGTDPKKIDIILIDPSGNVLLLQECGTFNQSEFESCLSKLESILKQ